MTTNASWKVYYCKGDQLQFPAIEVQQFLRLVITDFQQVPGVAAEIESICGVLQEIQELLPILTDDVRMFNVVCNAKTFLSGTEAEACGA